MPSGNFSNITYLVRSLGTIVADLIPILIGVAVIFFFYGLVKYIREPEKQDGKKIMIAGLISLFVMVSLWGIISFAGNAIGISQNNGGPLNPPAVGGLQP